MNLELYFYNINPFSIEFKQSTADFSTLSIPAKVATVALTAIAAIATAFLLGIGGVIAFRVLVDVFKSNETPKSTMHVSEVKPQTSSIQPSNDQLYSSQNLSDLSDHEIKTLQRFVSEMKLLNLKEESFVYADVPFKDKMGKDYDIGWYSQAFLSYISGFSEDPNLKTNAQSKTEEKMGKFIFALSFSNCHSHIKIEEPQIQMPDPLPDSSKDDLILFPNVEFYYQHFKRAIYVNGIKDPQQRKEICDSCRKDIQDQKFNDPNIAYQIGRTMADQPLTLSTQQLAYLDSVKVNVMEAAIYSKFSQNPLLREMLKATHPHLIVQLKKDSIWGPGMDGTGQNLLGLCLMNVRKALIENKSIQPPQLPT